MRHSVGMRTQHSITVPLPQAEVFAFLSNVANEVSWRKSIVGSRYVGADSPQVGVAGETDVAMGKKALTMKWAIIRFEPGSHVAWQLDGGPWRGGGSYTVVPSDGQSVIRAALEVKLRGIARLLEPLVWLQLRLGLRGDLRSLAGELLQTAAQ